MKKIKTKIYYSTYSIALSAMLTALLVVLKYAMGFMAGIEFVTFFTILYGLKLPSRYLILILPSFILITGIIYGMGTWWIMYWFIFPTQAFSSKLLSRYICKSSFFVSLWAGFWGFSMILWFAIQDYLLFGSSMAIANMANALVPNFIEGLCNLVAGFLLYPILSTVLEKSIKKNSNWNEQTNYVY